MRRTVIEGFAVSGFLNLVCPTCDAVRRMLATQADLGARCDKCGGELFLGQAIALDDVTRLQKHVVSNDVPVLVEFWAPWCGPCRVTAPEFEKAARRLEPRFRLARVDTDAVPEAAERYHVQAIPSLVLFGRGREMARWNGSIKAEGIVRFAKEHLDAEVEEPA